MVDNVSESLLYFYNGLSLLHLEQIILLYQCMLPYSLHIIHPFMRDFKYIPRIICTFEILKMNKMREKGSHSCFYTGSLNHKATSSLSGQFDPSFHNYQKFYKTHTKIILLNNRNTKIFESHKNINHNTVRITLIDLESH